MDKSDGGARDRGRDAETVPHIVDGCISPLISSLDAGTTQ
jgi:hypothetical protein